MADVTGMVAGKLLRVPGKGGDAVGTDTRLALQQRWHPVDERLGNPGIATPAGFAAVRHAAVCALTEGTHIWIDSRHHRSILSSTL